MMTFGILTLMLCSLFTGGNIFVALDYTFRGLSIPNMTVFLGTLMAVGTIIQLVALLAKVNG